MKYRCFRCDNFETSIKTHYVRHLKRKRPCPKVNNQEVGKLLEEIQNNSYTNRFENSKISEKYTKLNHFESQLNHSESQMNHSESQMNHFESQLNHFESQLNHFESQNIYKCKYCNKIFSTSSNKTRHESKYCIGRKTSGQNSLINYFSKKFDEIEGKREKERQKHEQEKSELRSQIEKLLEKVGNNNNNTTNKIETQIVLNNFGKENIEYINSNHINKLIQQGIYAAIPKIIKYLHFNPEHPENRNVKITNKKEAWAQIWNNDKWELKNKKLVINNIVNKGYNILDDKKKPDELSNKKKSKLCDFQDNYSNDDKYTHKYLNKEVETLILNESK